LVYLHLIPDPAGMLITDEWPAPAVATWKVVAESLGGGLTAIPASALWAIALGGVCGAAGAWLQHFRAPRWLPNMPALGLAMVIPASIAITMFLGSLIARLLERFRPSLAQRFTIAAASGLIAGESLSGVARALLGIVGRPEAWPTGDRCGLGFQACLTRLLHQLGDGTLLRTIRCDKRDCRNILVERKATNEDRPAGQASNGGDRWDVIRCTTRHPWQADPQAIARGQHRTALRECSDRRAAHLQTEPRDRDLAGLHRRSIAIRAMHADRQGESIPRE
jgi:hypothetical protein